MGSENGGFISWLESRAEARQKPIRELNQRVFNEISEIFELYNPPSSNLIPEYMGEGPGWWWSCIFIPLKEIRFRSLSRKFLDALEMEHIEHYYLRLVREKTKNSDRDDKNLERDKYELRIFVPSWERSRPRKQHEDVSIVIGGSAYSSYVHFPNTKYPCYYPHVIYYLNQRASEQEQLELVLDLIHSINNSIVRGAKIARFESVGFSDDHFRMPE